MIWEQKFDEIDTFEAFYKNFFYKNSVLVIPYINIGVSCHPINPSKKALYIDKSYLVFINACINKINGVLDKKCDQFVGSNFNSIDISGIDCTENRHIALQIFYERAFLQLLPESRLSREFWIPQKTPNFEVNMDEKDVEFFFSNKHMPENIKKLIG